MARSRTVYVCQDCGHQAPRWMGRCAGCGVWNRMLEETVSGGSARRASAGPGSTRNEPIPLDQVPDGGGEIRVRTGIAELDNVLGGGIVAGSVVLIGGDPGVGKSTLLLMALDGFARRGVDVLYITGEESLRQVSLRARRLGVDGSRLLLLAETDFAAIESALRRVAPRVAVVDSVQTVHVPDIESVPGSVSQVRGVAHRAMLLAKSTGTAVILVGHVTKSGDLAGPKVLEHLVDTVIQFEGDGRSSLRILRSVKNRFGAAGELGLFEMADNGLREVPDASARLLAERSPDAPGTAVTATLEGSRPVLTEVQALVGEARPQTPTRATVGVDRGRVTMLAAVMQKVGLDLQDRDIFANAAGGGRLLEPAADLAIVGALASSLRNRPIREDTVVFGEVGLVGEVRSVSYPALRLREAVRHGFKRVVAPKASVVDAPPGLEVVGVTRVADALDALL